MRQCKEEGDELSLGISERAWKTSALSRVLQGSFLDVNNPLTVSFLGGSEWGIRPLVLKIVIKFPVVSSLFISLAGNEPRHLFSCQVYSGRWELSIYQFLILYLPISLLVYLIAHIHSGIRECRIHLPIYMHWESCVSEIKSLNKALCLHPSDRENPSRQCRY